MSDNKWTLLMVGENHGIVGQFASTFANHPDGYRRVDVVEKTAMTDAATDMAKALENIIGRLQMDIDDGGRPDQWSMQALVAEANVALKKARGE